MKQRESQSHNTLPPHLGSNSHVPVWAGFYPATIVSLGVPTKPGERLIGLQSAVYRLIVILGNLPSLLRAWPSLRLSASFSRSSQPALEPE